MRTWKAEDLQRLLAERHAKDVWVPECNMGSAYAACRRLDGWAMKRSWSPWETVAYEIKVSRSDFRADQKWTDYLTVCHKFYFVTPPGLIHPQDLPPHVGLLWATVSGSRLITKVPAARHDPDPAKIAKLMAYVVMSRARIVGDMWEANGDRPVRAEVEQRGSARTEEYARHLAEAEQRKTLASFVRAQIRERLADAASSLETAQRIQRENEAFRDELRRQGLSWREGEWRWVDGRVSQVKILAGAASNGLLTQMMDLERRLHGLSEQLSVLDQGAAK